MFDIFDVDIDAIIRKAVELRRKLATEIDENDPARNSAAKHRQWRELRRVTAELRKIADGVVAAGLRLGGKPGRALDEAYENLRIAVKAAHSDSGEPDPSHLDSIIDRGLTPTVPTDYGDGSHCTGSSKSRTSWERGGFDAIIGNPPFLGGQKLTGAIGTNIRDWLVNVLAEGQEGKRRPGGVLLPARVSRCCPPAEHSASLPRTPSRKAIPVRSDSTEWWKLDSRSRVPSRVGRGQQRLPTWSIAAVWGSVGPVADDVPRISDDKPVKRITTLLEPGGRVDGQSGATRRERRSSHSSVAMCLAWASFWSLTEAQAWITEDAT